METGGRQADKEEAERQGILKKVSFEQPEESEEEDTEATHDQDPLQQVFVEVITHKAKVGMKAM